LRQRTKVQIKKVQILTAALQILTAARVFAPQQAFILVPVCACVVIDDFFF
jgi:hypothetical protein